jgi:hypothetical protein
MIRDYQTMKKIGYNTVAVRIFSLSYQIGNADPYRQVELWDEMNDHLEACGWSDDEFWEEVSKRIDQNWEDDKWD